MTAPISIIVPSLNASDELPGTLAALMPGLAQGLVHELVISDGGSADESLAIADAVGAVVVSGAPGRGGQLRRGAGVARGDWLLFVHADSHLGEDWCDAVSQHMAAFPDKAGYGRLSFRAQGSAPRFVAAWANWRSRYLGLPYGDQSLLISRQLYDQIGGFADIPLMEDVALARALHGRLRCLGTISATSATRYERQGWLRRGGRNLWLLARFLLGADPKALAEAYRR